MKKLALAAVLSAAATNAFAGSMADAKMEPVVEPVVVIEEAQQSSSSAGILIPLALLVLLAAAAAD